MAYPIYDEQLVNWFSYHKPTADQPGQYERLRAAALTFARVIKAECPGESPDTTAAIRKVREAVMTANAAIACDMPV